MRSPHRNTLPEATKAVRIFHLAAQKRELAHHRSVSKKVAVTYVSQSGPRVVKTQVVKIAG